MKFPSTGHFGPNEEKKKTRWKLKRSFIGATVDTMIIGGLVSGNKAWQVARQSRVARIEAVSRGSTDTASDSEADRGRRSSDAPAVPATDRRGIAPAVRSRSTQIVYDQRAVDRREIADRRRGTAAPQPDSEFVAQAVAREGMLLDLRPDPQETRRARTAYGGEGETAPTINRIDLIV